MSIQLVDVGFLNYIEASKITSVCRPDGAPIKRLIQFAKDNGRFVDLTQGRKTRSIIIQQGNDGLILSASAVQTATISDRIRRGKDIKETVEKISEDIIETSVVS